MLEETPNAEGSKEDIPSIFENNNINNGRFTGDEYTKALEKGHSAGTGNIKIT